MLTRWWEHSSLRNKITIVTVSVMTLGLMSIGIGTVMAIERYLVDEIDRKIAEAADNLPDLLTTMDFESFDRTRQQGISSEFYLAAVSASGQVMMSNLQEGQEHYAPDVSRLSIGVVSDAKEPLTLPSQDGETSWRVMTYRLRIINATSGQALPATLAIGVDLADTRQVVGSFASIFLAFSLVVVVLSAALIRLLVSNTLRPLRQVEETAARFAGGDFTQRLSASTPNTEVGRLTRSLNSMLSRIDRAFADRAETIDQMRRFIGDASHELRTPLVSVRGYAELYRMGALTDEAGVSQAMERIEKEATRMTSLVTDLLELARLDESKPLEISRVDLSALADDAALDARAQAPVREIRVNVTADEGDVVVLAEENKIRQVFINLMQNALRFSPDDSPIDIDVAVDPVTGDRVVRVIDHGQGIPPQIREHIFQRFYRADQSRTRETGGSGLGLAIVASIIRRHHGFIRVEETPGGGATFEFSLPAVHTPSL
jgi:two-component system, OmpR family, sensor kinase